MGCDWISGTLTYGFIVEYCKFYILFSPSEDEPAEDAAIQCQYPSEEDHRDRGNYYVEKCWKLFCGIVSEEDREIVKGIDCNFTCCSVAGGYESYELVEDCFFVFGHQLSQFMSMENLKLISVPLELEDIISNFIYLLNETDILRNYFIKKFTLPKVHSWEISKMTKEEEAMQLRAKKLSNEELKNKAKVGAEEALSKADPDKMEDCNALILGPANMIGCN